MTDAPGVPETDAAGIGAGGLRAWTGGFAEREVGIRLQNEPERGHVPLEALVGVALRRNPKRAQLLVSTVLAKHVPTEPGLVIVAAELLGLLVAGELDGSRPSPALFARLARILQSAEVGALRAEVAGLRAEVGELRSEHPEVVTIGYAETATGLGQLVAGTIGAHYIHSTRHAPVDAQPFAGFEEEHSHATNHQLYPSDPAWLRPGGTVVLVDDELSTGRTIVNTIRALHAAVPQARWVVASLIDLRSPDDRQRFDDLAAALGSSIAVVSLGAGSIALPPDAPERAARAIARAAAPAAPSPVAKGRESPLAATDETIAVPSREAGPLGRVTVLEVGAEAPRSARFGIDARPGAAAGSAAADSATAAAAAVTHALASGSSTVASETRTGMGATEVLVLGSEEFIALPLAIADHLAGSTGTSAAGGAALSSDAGTSAAAGGAAGRGGAARRVRFSTTTRSPIAALDRADYAIASAVTFQSHDLTSDGFGVRFAYNLTREGRRFDAIVFVPEPEADRERMLAPDGVVEALRCVTDHVVVAHLAPAPAPTSLPNPLRAEAVVPATAPTATAHTAAATTASPPAPAPPGIQPPRPAAAATPEPDERRLP